jgi:mannose-6-phosphate isomerase-like protein (cupin superfamily)
MGTRSVLVDLSTRYLSLDRQGKATMLESANGPPPRVDGYTIGAPRLTRNPPHGGEVHPDGDEILYLISGRIDVILEEADGNRTIIMEPGHSIVVPQGVWHRIEVREPCHLLFITPGPGGAHRPRGRARL